MSEFLTTIRNPNYTQKGHELLTVSFRVLYEETQKKIRADYTCGRRKSMKFCARTNVLLECEEK